MPVIRSQDGLRIVDTNNLYISKKVIFAIPYENKNVYLGTYATWERCKQVISEVEALINGKLPPNLYENAQEMYKAERRLNKKVYQMPEI